MALMVFINGQRRKDVEEKLEGPKLTEEELQKIDCEENNLHDFEGEQTCNSCGISYNEAHADDYDEGER